MSAIVLRGDARRLPLPDASVDLIVTSPPLVPYFGLRSYTDDGAHYDGQIGSEATPAEWLAALVACTAEWVRVLKPSGSIFVNLGDKYSGNETGGRLEPSGSTLESPARMPQQQKHRTPYRSGMRPKSLLGLPWRYALACMDELGLILRRDIIWSKPNSLPESVVDRCRSSHEYLFHFVKQPRYYSAVDEIRSPSADPPRRAHFAPPGRPALGPELRATVRTVDSPAAARGWCQLGSLQEGISAAMTGEAQGLQVLRPVGFHMRVETGERDYVIDLKPIAGPALDAAATITLNDALAELAPAGAAPCLVAAPPSGVLLADVILDDTSGRAEVLDLECIPVATEGLAARITLDLHPGRATLLVWDSLAAHRSILPQRSGAFHDHTADGIVGQRIAYKGRDTYNPLGKLPGSVWEIPSQPLVVPDWLGIQHFAAFPMELPRRCVLGWSPPGVCTACGEGRRPVMEKALGPPTWQRVNRNNGPRTAARLAEGDRDHGLRAFEPDTRGSFYGGITGYACACPQPDAPVRPALVVDPFGGTGTTALVAAAYGRTGVSVDLSGDYCRLARWRTADPAERARALLVPKPPPVPDGQASLFDLEDAGLAGQHKNAPPSPHTGSPVHRGDGGASALC